MFRFYTITFVLSYCSVAFSQSNYSKKWIYSVDSAHTHFDIAAKTSEIDTFGNVYITGQFSGIVDFNQGPGNVIIDSGGQPLGYVLKIDVNGQFEWVRTFESTSFSYCNDIHIDELNQIFIGGGYGGTTTFSNSPFIQKSSNGQDDAFFMKMTDQGDILWVQSFGGINNESVDRIHSSNSSIYAGLSFFGTVDFDPGPSIFNLTSQLTSDLAILRTNQNGDFINAWSIGNDEQIFLGGLEVDASNNIYVTGAFSDTLDIDPGAGNNFLSSTNQEEEIFIFKWDSSGNPIWAQSIGSHFNDLGENILVDSNYIYLTGWFSGTVDFDNSVNDSILSGSQDFFLLQLDLNGNFQWVEEVPLTNFLPSSLTSGKSGGVIFSAKYNGEISLANGTEVYFDSTSSGSFLFAFDSLSNVLDAISIQNQSHQAFRTYSAQYHSGEYILTGAFKGVVDTNPNFSTELDTSSSTSLYDIFAIRLEECMNTTGDTIVIETCHSFAPPDGSVERFQSGFYDLHYQNSQGCDSIIVLELTINPVDTVQIQQVVCDSTYSWFGSLLDSSGVYSQTITGSHGCDSIVFLDLSFIEINTTVTDFFQYFLATNNPDYSYQWLNCSNGYSEVWGETNPSYVPTLAGQYAVQISYNGCLDTSDCFSYIGLGLEEEKEFVTVYPNPNAGDFVLHFDDYELLQIKVYDQLGNVVETFDNVSSQTLIKTDLSAGMYNLVWNKDGYSFNKKLIIQN